MKSLIGGLMPMGNQGPESGVIGGLNCGEAGGLAGVLELKDDHWNDCIAQPILFWETNRKPVS